MKVRFCFNLIICQVSVFFLFNFGSPQCEDDCTTKCATKSLPSREKCGFRQGADNMPEYCCKSKRNLFISNIKSHLLPDGFLLRVSHLVFL